MKKEPVLVIMAAGMGSRYGGLKQIDPLNSEGDLIIDFSIYDAMMAGFKKVIFIVKKENEKDFRERIGDRIKDHIEVEYVYQSIDDLPEGIQVPEGRQKPWGTGHAILSCRDIIDGPFAVINADDYYGRDAFEKLYQFLAATEENSQTMHYAMVGYILSNTLTENGHVARGVCETDSDSKLLSINERTQIIKKGDHAAYTEDNGQTWIDLPADSTVSMNMWGFDSRLIQHLKNGFNQFLKTALTENPQKAEYYLPEVVDHLINSQKADVTVLKTSEKWYGVTYKDDKPAVTQAITNMKTTGKYPPVLWPSKTTAKI